MLNEIEPFNGNENTKTLFSNRLIAGGGALALGISSGVEAAESNIEGAVVTGIFTILMLGYMIGPKNIAKIFTRLIHHLDQNTQEHINQDNNDIANNENPFSHYPSQETFPTIKSN